MLNEKEFDRLQKLACIKLDIQDKKKLWDQLTNIIDFLDKLKNIKVNLSTGQECQTEIEKLKLDNSLRVVSWIRECEDSNWLLSNVKHNIVNNNIVVKSVLN